MQNKFFKFSVLHKSYHEPKGVLNSYKKAKELGKTVILNPAPAPEIISDEILECIDYLTPNETELMKIAKTDSIELEDLFNAAKKLLHKGVKNLVVTLGERGALLINNEKCEVYPAKKVKAIDTTAAGDCFNGALVVALAEGKSEKEAIEFANIVSAIAVTREGAQTSIPTRKEVEDMLLINQGF